MNRKRKFTIGGAVIGTAAITGSFFIPAAMASTASVPDTNGSVHFCYQVKTGNARIIDIAKQHCLTGEKPVSTVPNYVPPAPTPAPSPQYVTSSVVYSGLSTSGPTEKVIELNCPSGTHALNGGVDNIQQTADSGYHITQPSSAIEAPSEELSADGTHNLGLPRAVSNDTAWRMHVTIGNGVEVEDQVGAQPPATITVTYFVVCQ